MEQQAAVSKMETTQTAVEWIEDNIQSDMTFMEFMGLIRQAKAMEKEQVVKAWDLGRRDIDYHADGEQYYNETYNK
jgi:hypothetical protein